MDQEAPAAIQFEGQYDRADVLHALQLHLKPTRAELLIRLALLVAIVAAVPVYLMPRLSENATSMIIWVLPGLLVLYIIALPWVAPYQNVGRVLKNDEISGGISGIVTEKSITIHNVRKTSEIAWEDYRGVKKGQGFVLLYQSGRWFNLFPQHFFLSDSDWQKFTQMVEAKLPARN